jgi:hypothetical protein
MIEADIPNMCHVPSSAHMRLGRGRAHADRVVDVRSVVG